MHIMRLLLMLLTRMLNVSSYFHGENTSVPLSARDLETVVQEPSIFNQALELLFKIRQTLVDWMRNLLKLSRHSPAEDAVADFKFR